VTQLPYSGMVAFAFSGSAARTLREKSMERNNRKGIFFMSF
jgi:hypothetical protein